MQEIAIKKLYHFTVNSEYTPLPDVCIGQILKILVVDMITSAESIQTPVERGQFSLSTLYRDLDWRWMAQRGTLGKRIAKWFYDKYKIKVSPTAISAIGNAVREHVVKNQEYHLDFTNKFDWSGQFGDWDSCFWKDRSEARIAMEKSGKFLAVRFFDKKDMGTFITTAYSKTNEKENKFYTEDSRYIYNGLARAWIGCDTIERNKVKSPVWIVFNGYGIATKQIATIVAAFHNQSMKRIEITNNGSSHGGLYANGSGYLIGPESLIKDKTVYDFGIPYASEKPVVKPGFSETKLEARKRPPNLMEQVRLMNYRRAWGIDPEVLEANNYAGGLLQYIQAGPQMHFHIPEEHR